MIKILMLETHKVSLHGYSAPEELIEGENYEVPPDLASTMIEQGWCAEVQEFDETDLKTGPATGKPRVKMGDIPLVDETGDNTETEPDGDLDPKLPSGELKVLEDINYLPDGAAHSWVFAKDDRIKIPDQVPHDVTAIFIKKGWAESVGGKKSALSRWAKKLFKG